MKELKLKSLGTKFKKITKDHSWLRSNYTTGEGGKIDTYSLLEFEDDLTPILKKKVEEKKMQEWDEKDISIFLKEIKMCKFFKILS